MDTFLTKIANFSESAMWVVGALFVVDFVAILICAYLTGTTDVEQGRVVTRRGRPSGLIAGQYWSKRKALVSRRVYISEMSLVDGTATPAQRLIAHGTKFAFLLFWLAFIFGILTLLSSEPGLALTMLFIMCCLLCSAVNLMRRSRAHALRKLAEQQARRKTT